MEMTKSGSQPSAKGPADWFTGAVRIDSRFQREAPARVGGAAVTFEPGARTAWHTHPLGQTLLIIAGCGRVQRDGGPIRVRQPAAAHEPLTAALPIVGLRLAVVVALTVGDADGGHQRDAHRPAAQRGEYAPDSTVVDPLRSGLAAVRAVRETRWPPRHRLR